MRFMLFGIFIALLSWHSTVSASESCADKPVVEVVTFKLAAVSLQENPAAQQFFSHIDPNSVALNYYCE